MKDIALSDMGVVAEFEGSILRERQEEGIQAIVISVLLKRELDCMVLPIFYC